MDPQKIEDSILKLASEIFSKEVLPYFGINEKVVASVPTELIRLELSRQYTDYTYLTEKDVYHHFEFQSTDGKVEDLQRFHAYEAIMVMKTGKTVVTHVIYSGDIKNPLSGYEYGINRYNVDVITLSDKDAKKVLERIEDLQVLGHDLTRQDCLELILIPLMGGDLTKQEKILRALKITRDMQQEETKQIQAMLYAFSEKFLTKEEKKPIEEVIMMTELGQMILERGFEKGVKEGIKEGMDTGIELTKTAFKLAKEGMEIPQIAEELNLPIEKIEKMME